MRITDIYRLSQDFDDYFIINNEATYFPKLIKVNMTEKVLDGRKYDNLYALEPTEHYFLTVDSPSIFTRMNFDKSEFIRIGLLVDEVFIDNKFYISLYNKTNNIIYITKDIEV